MNVIDMESILAERERARHVVGEPALRGPAPRVDGDLRTGRESWEEAYLAAERAGDDEALATAALGLAGLWVDQQRGSAAAALVQARLRHALSVVDPSSPLAPRLRARIAGEADYRAGTHSAIIAVLDQARGSGDPVARAEALSLAYQCVLGPDHGPLRHTLATELLAESSRTGRRIDLLTGLLWQSVDLLLRADPHAERRLGELRDLLARADHLAVRFVVNAVDVMFAIRAGRLEEAELTAQRCAQSGMAAGDPDAASWYGAHLVAIRWYQGRLPELLPMLTGLVHSPSLSPVDNSYFAALAVAAAMTSDHRTASAAMARLCAFDLAGLPRSSSWLVTLYGIVEAAHLLGDAGVSQRAYELLSPYSQLPMMASLGVACFGSVEHALGVASLTTGRVDRAVAHFGEAVQRNLAMGHWPAVVLSRQRHAQALALRGRPDDAVLARRERATLTDEAGTLGIPLRLDDRAESGPLVCARRGRQWLLARGGRSVVVEHCVGMLHLAVLIANPDVEIPAIDLAAGVAALRPKVDGVSAQPVLDQVARQQYRRRLSELTAQIEEMESNNQAQRASTVRAEHDWLLAELAGATGIGGRTRQFPTSVERARLAVGRAIRRAIDRAQAADPRIGEHLRVTVHTGVRCSYLTDSPRSR